MKLKKIKFFIVAAVIIAGLAMCNKGTLKETNNLGYNITFDETSPKDRDIALSLWYVNQQGAIELLSKILDEKIIFGSKIEDSPFALLARQKKLIQASTSEKFDHELEPWTRQQEKILGELKETLKCKIEKAQIDAESSRRQGLIYLEVQEKIISKLDHYD